MAVVTMAEHSGQATPSASGCCTNPGERAGWVLSMGSQIGQRLRHATAVRPDAVAASPSRGDLCERAATFPRRPHATATVSERKPRPVPGLGSLRGPGKRVGVGQRGATWPGEALMTRAAVSVRLIPGAPVALVDHARA